MKENSCCINIRSVLSSPGYSATGIRTQLFLGPGIVLKNIQHLAGTRACYTYFIVLAL